MGTALRRAVPQPHLAAPRTPSPLLGMLHVNVSPPASKSPASTPASGRKRAKRSEGEVKNQAPRRRPSSWVRPRAFLESIPTAETLVPPLAGASEQAGPAASAIARGSNEGADIATWPPAIGAASPCRAPPASAGLRQCEYGASVPPRSGSSSPCFLQTTVGSSRAR